MTFFELLKDESLPNVKLLHRKALSPNECVLVAGENIYTVTSDGVMSLNANVYDLTADDWEVMYFFDARE